MTHQQMVDQLARGGDIPCWHYPNPHTPERQPVRIVHYRAVPSGRNRTSGIYTIQLIDGSQQMIDYSHGAQDILVYR